ncbi:MAG: zf-TFIIB domain-containing protein [Blautia sp.]|nr:zf-TFIIB domain-containing protein [Blautia sp.]
MREKFYHFMEGRNGTDELARLESWVILVLLIVGIFSRLGIFTILALALMIHMYFRVFSKNTAKRREENQKYVNFRYQRTVQWNKWKKRMGQRKIYRYYKCPACKQQVRVPKGHGKIEITCPKCRGTFVRRS